MSSGDLGCCFQRLVEGFRIEGCERLRISARESLVVQSYIFLLESGVWATFGIICRQTLGFQSAYSYKGVSGQDLWLQNGARRRCCAAQLM